MLGVDRSQWGVGKEKPRRAREALRVARRRPIQMDVGPMTHMALSKVIPTLLGWVVREGH